MSRVPSGQPLATITLATARWLRRRSLEGKCAGLRLASFTTFRSGSLLAARQNGFVIYGGLSRDGFPCSAAAAGLAQAVRVLLAVDVSQLFSPSLSSPPSFSFGVACVMGAVWPMCGRLAVGRRGEVSSPGVGEG